jgi:hypothetical protein
MHAHTYLDFRNRVRFAESKSTSMHVPPHSCFWPTVSFKEICLHKLKLSELMQSFVMAKTKKQENHHRNYTWDSVVSSSANASSRHCAKEKKNSCLLNALILIMGRTPQYSGRVPPYSKKTVVQYF